MGTPLTLDEAKAIYRAAIDPRGQDPIRCCCLHRNSESHAKHCTERTVPLRYRDCGALPRNFWDRVAPTIVCSAARKLGLDYI